MMVLVNPADVVAVPPVDGYGKMRTCAYYPVAIVEFNSDGHIIEPPIEDGFEDDFFEKICYQGQKNDNDLNPYEVKVPEIPELDKSKINNRLLSIARNLNKTVDEIQKEEDEKEMHIKETIFDEMSLGQLANFIREHDLDITLNDFDDIDKLQIAIIQELEELEDCTSHAGCDECDDCNNCPFRDVCYLADGED